jgi:hypothetical protein
MKNKIKTIGKITILSILLTYIISYIIFFLSIKTETVYIYKIKEIDETHWNNLIDVLIDIESNNNDSAVGRSNDVGCLQITPIYLKEVNNIIEQSKFKLNDRYDRQKSIKMFNIMQDYYNPQKDIKKAIWLHNKGRKYEIKVLNKILNKNLK